ncbi:MAG: hypothetical protein COA73_05860 [Candidatus Hydrogenedentota bacterium]|nr:MAG: hypothetical protein COA73_05860 [Candidatus Hydrogenedentota bacterium]
MSLGVFIYIMFVRLQIAERETQLPEEEGETPIFESIGKGAMNNASPVRKPFARITLYDTFLAACLKSQRKTIFYKDILSMSLEEYAGREWLHIKAATPDGEIQVLFHSRDHQSLMEQIEIRSKAS